MHALPRSAASPIDSNGFDGLATTLKINGPFGVKMMELLARGAKEGWFTYGGRVNKAEALMTAGECGIFTTSSAYIGNLTRAARASSRGAPGSLPRLARLPAGQLDHRRRHALGHEGRQARGVQGRRAVLQVSRFHREPGVVGGRDRDYLPLTNAAAKAMEASGHYAKNPNQKTAVNQMNSGKTTPNSQGIRLGNFNSVRDAIEEQMEYIFSGNKTGEAGPRRRGGAKRQRDPEGVRRSLQVVCGSGG